MTTFEGITLFQLGLLVVLAIRMEVLAKRYMEDLRKVEWLLRTTGWFLTHKS